MVLWCFRRISSQGHEQAFKRPVLTASRKIFYVEVLKLIMRLHTLPLWLLSGVPLGKAMLVSL